jgi:hypothetical protein
VSTVTKDPVTKDPVTGDQETLDELERLARTLEECGEAPFRMLQDAIDIADSSARADVECHCPWTYLKETDDASSRWYDTARIDPEDAAHLEQALRYLRARGRINHHPEQPHLVNFDGVPG